MHLRLQPAARDGQGTDPPAARLELLPMQKDGPALEALPVDKTPDRLDAPRFEAWAY